MCHAVPRVCSFYPNTTGRGFTDKHTSAREEELSSVSTCMGRAASALYTNCPAPASVDAEGLVVWAVVLPRCPHWLPTFPKTTCLQLLPPMTSPVRVWPKSYVSVLYMVKATVVSNMFRKQCGNFFKMGLAFILLGNLGHPGVTVGSRNTVC